MREFSRRFAPAGRQTYHPSDMGSITLIRLTPVDQYKSGIRVVDGAHFEGRRWPLPRQFSLE